MHIWNWAQRELWLEHASSLVFCKGEYFNYYLFIYLYCITIILYRIYIIWTSVWVNFDTLKFIQFLTTYKHRRDTGPKLIAHVSLIYISISEVFCQNINKQEKYVEKCDESSTHSLNSTFSFWAWKLTDSKTTQQCYIMTVKDLESWIIRRHSVMLWNILLW